MCEMSSKWLLRQIMADRKLTNEQVASRLSEITQRNRHSVTISRWKQYDMMPKIDGIDLDALCAALGCTRDELLGSQELICQ